MKFDSSFIDVLKNFSSINNAIIFTQGSQLKSLSDKKIIMAEATLPFSFDKTFGIADLQQFLGCLSLAKDAEVNLDDKFLEITSGSNTIRYFYSDTSMITHPEKPINLGPTQISFNLSNNLLTDIHKSALVLSVDDLKLTKKDDSTILVSVLSKTDPTSNSAFFEIPGKSSCDEYTVYIKVSNLKVLPRDYSIKIAKTASFFEAVNSPIPVCYYIALDADSKIL